jgi:hypothetical protein
MQNLRNHFNRKARRKRELDHYYFILWLMLLIILEQQRQLQRDTGYTPRPPRLG